MKREHAVTQANRPSYSASVHMSHALARARREAKRMQLGARRLRVRGDLYVNYGWIRLLYCGDGDVQEILYHLNQREWRDNEMSALRPILRPGATVVDVGANLGFVTVLLAELVGPNGRVFSFEPSQTVFAKLEKTVAANSLRQVSTYNMACGQEPGFLALSKVNRSSGNSSLIAAGAERETVQVMPLDAISLSWGRRVDFMKIDTEGFEPEVLSGAKRILAEDRPVIYIEMGGDYLQSTLRTVELLKEFDYNTRHVDRLRWSKVGNGSNYLFRPHERAPSS
jgi:FkbM family methyltransferase